MGANLSREGSKAHAEYLPQNLSERTKERMILFSSWKSVQGRAGVKIHQSWIKQN